MSPPTALERLRALLKDDMFSTREAQMMLRRYRGGTEKFPADREAKLLSLLQEVDVEAMGSTDHRHRNDKKRSQRSHGQRLRLNRTGSRRG